MPSPAILGSGILAAPGSGNVVHDLSGLGLADGDTVVFFGLIDGAAHPAKIPGPVTEGYEELVTPHIDSTSGRPCGGVWSKKMGSTPDTEVEGQGSGSTITRSIYGFYALRDMDPAQLLDAAYNEISGTGGPQDPAAVTTLTDHALVLVVALQGLVSTTPSAAPSGYGNFLAAGSGGTWDLALAAALKEVTPAGSENPGTFTWSDVNQAQHIFTVPLRVAGNSTKPLAPDLALTGLASSVRFNTGDFQPHPDDPTDTQTAAQYRLSTTPDMGSLVVNVEVGAPNLTEYEATGLAAGTYYGDAAHVGENFDGDRSAVVSVEVSGATAGNAPDTTLVAKAHDFIEVQAEEFTHPDGAVEPGDYDGADPHPYLVTTQIQRKLTSAGDWSGAETIEVTYNGLPESRQARFEGLTGGVSHDFRSLQIDNFGASTGYGAVLTVSTDATPSDAPLQPTISVTCGRDTLVELGTYAHEAVGAGTAHAKTEFGISYDGGGFVYLIVNSPVTSITWPDLGAGTASFKGRYGDDSTPTRWGPYSAVEECEIPTRPSFVKFTGPTTLKVSTNQTVSWIFTDTSEAWLSNIERAVGSGAFVAVASNQVGQSTPFNVGSLQDNIYIYRVQAVHPDTGELGEWASLPITLSRAGSTIRVFHKNAIQLAAGGAGGEQKWDGPAHISWTGKVEAGIGVGLFATRVHGGSQMRRSFWVFREAGQLDSGSVIVGLAHRFNECEWPPWRFANPQVTDGGAGMLVDGNDAPNRWGRATMMEIAAQPWYLAADMPCSTNIYKVKALATTAWWAAKNPTRSWRYGRSNSYGKLRTFTGRNGTSSLTQSSATLGSPEDDLIGGAYGSTGGLDQVVYIQTEVTPTTSGGNPGWNTRARFLGAGISDAWTATTFVRQTDTSGKTIDCGYCGFAYEDMDQIGVGRSLGILFTSITIRTISVGTCEEPEEECVSGKTLNRILSIERHPSHAVIKYMAIGSVPCPEVEA